MPTNLSVGINLDGVLHHDGLPTPDAATRFAWVRDSGAFDYIEKNHNPAEDFAPYFDLVQEYGVPIGVFGGIFCAGRDEERMRWCVATGGQLGAKVFNMQLFARRADGEAITDQQVVDFFLDAMEHGAPVGCLPSLEVHVDMWSEHFARVERVAELLARRHVPLRTTLDHSHLVFKMEHPQELALSGLAETDSREVLPAFYRLWLAEGWGGPRPHPQRGPRHPVQQSHAAPTRPTGPRHPVPLHRAPGRHVPQRLGCAGVGAVEASRTRAAGRHARPPSKHAAAHQLRVHPVCRLRWRRALFDLGQQPGLRGLVAGRVEEI